MFYDNKNVQVITFGSTAFTAASTLAVFTPPPGKVGRILNVGIAGGTTAFACTTTPAALRIGTSANADAYARLNIPDLTATDTVFDIADDTDAIVAEDIPADTQVKIAVAAGVDETAAAGVAFPFVVIEWF